MHHTELYQTFLLSTIIGLIIHLKFKIMATEAEVIAKLNLLDSQVQKVGVEVTAVKDALADAVANGGQISPALEAAVAALGTSIQVVDDLNPDVEEEIAPAE